MPVPFWILAVFARCLVIQRQFRGRLDFGQRDRRINFLHAGQFAQLIKEKAFIGVEHLGKSLDRGAEFVEVRAAVRVQLDLGKDMRVEPDLAPVDDRHALLDEPVAFEPVDPAPAGRYGQPDALGDFGRRLIRVALQFAENLYLEQIKVGHFIRIEEFCGLLYPQFDAGGRIANKFAQAKDATSDAHPKESVSWLSVLPAWPRRSNACVSMTSRRGSTASLRFIRPHWGRGRVGAACGPTPICGRRWATRCGWPKA